jgi:S-ribosylhomocysteine lyase
MVCGSADAFRALTSWMQALQFGGRCGIMATFTAFDVSFFREEMIMEQEVTRITSFSINHDVLLPGLYVSRVDGDVTTYDMRTRRPNTGDLMDNSTMHSLEHMFATYIRNGDLKDSVVYFGPMGCQTGFYLLVRNADNAEVLRQVRLTLMKILAHEGPVFGASSRECGNYRNLSLAAAKTEAKRYLSELDARPVTFQYKE